MGDVSDAGASNASSPDVYLNPHDSSVRRTLIPKVTFLYQFLLHKCLLIYYPISKLSWFCLTNQFLFLLMENLNNTQEWKYEMSPHCQLQPLLTFFHSCFCVLNHILFYFTSFFTGVFLSTSLQFHQSHSSLQYLDTHITSSVSTQASYRPATVQLRNQVGILALTRRGRSPGLIHTLIRRTRQVLSRRIPRDDAQPRAQPHLHRKGTLTAELTRETVEKAAKAPRQNSTGLTSTGREGEERDPARSFCTAQRSTREWQNFSALLTEVYIKYLLTAVIA